MLIIMTLVYGVGGKVALVTNYNNTGLRVKVVHVSYYDTCLRGGGGGGKVTHVTNSNNTGLRVKSYMSIICHTVTNS